MNIKLTDGTLTLEIKDWNEGALAKLKDTRDSMAMAASLATLAAKDKVSIEFLARELILVMELQSANKVEEDASIGEKTIAYLNIIAGACAALARIEKCSKPSSHEPAVQGVN